MSSISGGVVLKIQRVRRVAGSVLGERGGLGFRVYDLRFRVQEVSIIGAGGRVNKVAFCA